MLTAPESKDSAQQVLPIYVDPTKFWDLLNELSKTLPPYHFQGIEKYNPKLAEGYRAFVKTMPQNQERQHLQPLPLLNEIANQLIAFIKVCKQKLPAEAQSSSKILDGIMEEVSDFASQDRLIPTWFFSALFRTAAALETTSEEEIEVFRHAAHDHDDPHFMQELFQYRDQEWQADSSSHVHALMDIAGKYLICQGMLVSNNIAIKLEKKLEATLPIQVYYPIIGEKILGITLLLSLYLQQVGLLALSDSRGEAHGIPMSPLSFMGHDLFHIQSNRKSITSAILSYAEYEMQEHVKDAGVAEPAVEPVVAIAVQKHDLLMHTLQTILQRFLTQLPPEGLHTLNKRIAGFFYTIHEVQKCFNAKTFMSKELETTINHICDAGIEQVMSPESWESPEDPFMTSPLTGEILLGAEAQNQLIETLTTQKLQQQENSLYLTCFPEDYYTKSKEEKIKCLKSLITNVVLENNERFIDLTITFQDGKTLKSSIATLYHKWRNAEDAIGLLKFAGISIEKPNLESVSPEKQRELVMHTLTSVQEGLKEVIHFFRQEALECATTQEPETGTTLAKRYYVIFEKMQDELKEKLSKCKKSESFNIHVHKKSLLPGFQCYLAQEKTSQDITTEKKVIEKKLPMS